MCILKQATIESFTQPNHAYHGFMLIKLYLHHISPGHPFVDRNIGGLVVQGVMDTRLTCFTIVYLACSLEQGGFRTLQDVFQDLRIICSVDLEDIP